MSKAKYRNFSSNICLFSTAFSVCFVSMIHPSSLQEVVEKRLLLPNGVDRRLFISTNRGQWNGFKLPKDLISPLHSIINPINELTTLLNTKKELEENSQLGSSIPEKDVMDYMDEENQIMEKRNSHLEGKKESRKNIYQLIGSFPELSGNGWELEFPKGRQGARQWDPNLFNEKEDYSETVQTNVEQADKRAKRVMCHFKICNLGRRRRARFSNTPQGWLS